MNNLKSMITDNPMLVEVRRFGRKFFGVSRFNRTNAGLLWLSGAIYLLVLIIALAYREGASATGIIEVQTGILCFTVPTVTYGAIAGERERRSWDLLMVSPLSKAQIVIGKYISAVVVVSAVVLLMLPITILCWHSGESFVAILSDESSSIGFGFGFAALGILVSSLMNRAFAAQATIYGILLGWMLVYPLFVGILSSLEGFGNALPGYLLWAHPFVVGMVNASPHNMFSNEPYPEFAYLLPMQVALYSLITACSLKWAIHAIRMDDRGIVRGARNA